MGRDLYLKRYLSDKRRFADLINGFVAEGRQLVSASDLYDLGSQTESTRTQKYRDRLKKALFGVNFMVIGVEGQEMTNYLMPMRCMSYDTAEYERQAADRRRERTGVQGMTSAEFLSRFGTDDRLKPCVTLILYFGEHWDGATRLHELLDFTDIPEELRILVSDYQIHVLEVQKLTDTTVFHTDVKQVFDAVRFSKDPEKFRELIFTDPAYRNLDIEAYDVIAQYVHTEELELISEMNRKGEKVDMCLALKMIMQQERDEGRNEGRNEGRREGRREGRNEGIISSILDILCEYGVVSDELKTQITAEDNLDTLKRWVKLAARVNSIEEFEQQIG